MKIKICGLTRPEDIACVNRLLPDYIGFVFWRESRRFVSEEQAAGLKAALSLQIKAVGVFVDAPVEEIADLLRKGVIDMAQLHGEESEEDVRRIRELTGKPVIRAVKVSCRRDVEEGQRSAADYLLFDSGMGGGRTFDWSLLGEVKRPYFLAGGLGEDNLEQVLAQVRPYGVDLSSSLETDGYKDPQKMGRVMEMIRSGRRDRRSHVGSME
ncbi:MAG: phosphoribosylanthranilate isomerase [bacterium]|nr:phosphoribosylanthranilate isomerase [bacterium]MCM1375949.1 phosphoribosylanthranilate isomerase [Muribaculum sp.]